MRNERFNGGGGNGNGYGDGNKSGGSGGGRRSRSRAPSRDRGGEGDGRNDSRRDREPRESRGSGNGESRGGGPRSGGRGGSRRSSYGRSRGSNRQAFDSGNQRERIAVESGHLIFIDQFMLANPQFIAEYAKLIDESEDQKNSLIEKFGGLVVDLDPGTYRIERNPYQYTILIHPEGVSSKDVTFEQSSKSSRVVFIDTRCIAMIDRELLDDSSLLEKYQQLWFSGQDKACRDLLRDNGGAVRYGFSRTSDELEILLDPETSCVSLQRRETPEGSLVEGMAV